MNIVIQFDPTTTKGWDRGCFITKDNYYSELNGAARFNDTSEALEAMNKAVKQYPIHKFLYRYLDAYGALIPL
jgi:hypothetical protein